MTDLVERLAQGTDGANWTELFSLAAAEITRLNAALKYEEIRSDRIGTHGPGCWSWGPRHYECLVAEADRQREQLDALKDQAHDL